MSFQPKRPQETVTIVMIALDQYSLFPKAVDSVLKETRTPFELVIIEGCAPQSVRHELEAKRKKHKNIRIIYSDHRPRMNEAYNLGMPHVRTRLAFFMHNNLLVKGDWLTDLIKYEKEHSGIIAPYVSFSKKISQSVHTMDYPIVFSQGRSKEALEVDMHGFLVSKATLAILGHFDENVSTPLAGVDLGHRLKKHGIPLFKHPGCVLEYLGHGPLKGYDRKLFNLQWSDTHTAKSLSYLNQLHGLTLDHQKYMDWLSKKHLLTQNGHNVPWTPSIGSGMALTAPKLTLKHFLDVLSRA